MKKKSIVKNSIYNMIYKGFTALFPLLTTTYISRVLLASGVGKVSYANTVVTYFVTIAALGLPNYGVKAIAQTGNSKDKRSKTFIELITINFISTVICAVVYYLVINNVSHFSDRRLLFNVMGIMLIMNIFNMDWFYQGIEEYGYIATRSIIVKIISFFLMLLFVKKPSDYVIYALILCIATAGNYIFNALHLKRYITIRRFDLDMKKHMNPIFILLAAALATEIYTMLDSVMLEYVHGDLYVGYYSNAVKIVRMIYTVVIALVATFYPRISYYLKNDDTESSIELLEQGTKIIILFSIPCVLGVIMTAKMVVPVLFGQSFMPAIFTLKVLSILIFVFSIAYFLGHVVLMASGNEMYILRATICGAIINAVLNLILIKPLYQNGAAISSVVAEILVTVMMLKKTFTLISLNISKQFIKSVFLANIALIVVVLMVEKVCTLKLISLAISVFMGVCAYVIILLLLKNDLAIELKEKLENRLKKM